MNRGNHFIAATVALLATLLAGCFDGDNKQGGADNQSRTFEGRAVKGVIRHGLVAADEYVDGGWQAFSSGATDADGRFHIDLSDARGPVRIVISADHQTRMVCDAVAGCDGAAFGDDVLPPENFRMITMVPRSQRSGEIAVTPLTHLAASWIESLPEEVQPTDEVIRLAQHRVADLFGLSNNFATTLPLDITADEVTTDHGAVLHAVVGASFAGVASLRGEDVQSVMDQYAADFAERAGQLTVLSLESETLGMDLITQAGQALLDELSDPEMRQALLDSLNNMVARWSGESQSYAGGFDNVDPQDVASAMVLLDDLDHYMNRAAAGAALAMEMGLGGHAGWSYASTEAAQDTSSLVRVVLESVLVGQHLSQLHETINYLPEDVLEQVLAMNCIDLYGAPEFSALNLEPGFMHYCIAERELRISGERLGQQVDAVLDVPVFVPGEDPQLTLRGHQGAEASFANATATATLSGTLRLITDGISTDGNGNLLPVRLGMDANIAFSLQPAQASAAYSGHLDGGITLDMNGFFSDVPALAANIRSAVIEDPMGRELWSLHSAGVCGDSQPLELAIGEHSVLDACYGFRFPGLPDMTFTSAGTLDGLFTLGGEILVGISKGYSIAQSLAGVDPSVLVLSARSALHILDTERGERRYQLDLNNARLDASLVNTGDSLSFRLVSLEGGYIVSGDTLVATVHSDWRKLGGTIKFADGQPDRQFGLAMLDEVDNGALQLLSFLASDISTALATRPVMPAL